MIHAPQITEVTRKAHDLSWTVFTLKCGDRKLGEFATRSEAAAAKRKHEREGL